MVVTIGANMQLAYENNDLEVVTKFNKTYSITVFQKKIVKQNTVYVLFIFDMLLLNNII